MDFDQPNDNQPQVQGTLHLVHILDGRPVNQDHQLLEYSLQEVHMGAFQPGNVLENVGCQQPELDACHDAQRRSRRLKRSSKKPVILFSAVTGDW